jgi:hypothetical protein
MKKQFIFILLIALFVSSCQTGETDIDTSGGTGLKQNSPSSLENVDEADIDEDNHTLPSEFTLSGPPIVDQGETSKCVAFSGGYYIIGMYNGVTTTNLDKSGSPDFMYAQYKKINSDTDCGDGCFLFNEGNTLGGAEILLQYGTTSWRQLPFVDANTCSVINSTLVSQAAVNKIKDYYRLSPEEAQDVEELKSWLYAGYPLWIGVQIDEGFQELEAGEVWKKARGNNEGGHAMVIVGYDDDKKAFKIANSWGTDWADNGFGWADYTYFTSKILALPDAEIGVLMPNDAQRIIMGNVTPIGCGKSGWGDIVINNNLSQEIAVEMSGANNYKNDDTTNIYSKDSEIYVGIPKGAIKVKVFNASKSTLLKEYDVNVSQCKEVVLEVK